MFLIIRLSSTWISSNFTVPELLSLTTSHLQQPLLVNNNSLFKNSSINLFALLLSVHGLFPHKTVGWCIACLSLAFSYSLFVKHVLRSGKESDVSLANTSSVIAMLLQSSTVKYSSQEELYIH